VAELTINVIPLIVGRGIPLFASSLPEVPLRFVESKS